MNNKTSFKKRMMQFNIFMLIILAGFMLLNHLLNRNTTQKYSDTVQLYDEISEFYSNLEQTTSNLKGYLYSEKQEDYLRYTISLQNSKEGLADIYSRVSNEVKWRFKLLQNMLDNYEQSASNITSLQKVNDQAFQEEYIVFLGIHDSIYKTSNNYYEYITEEMKVQKQNIVNQVDLILLISGIIALFGLLWMLVFSIYTIRAFTNPLHAILKNMKQIKEGEYDLSKVSNTSTEMEELSLALEDMAKGVKQNILNEQEKANLKHQLLQQEKENIKKDELLAQSDLKMLQNQINPHFLFNTLNMIYKTAQVEDAKTTGEMIDKTSELLRYALDKANRTSDLESEIKVVESYLYIQRKRFNERIHFELMVDEHIHNIQIPGFIVQPLIENAVKHGMHDVVEDGEVIIEVHEDGECIHISVSDNGKGMDTKRLEELMLIDFREENHLGLFNVIQRIKMFYGNHAKISFNSFPDCGFEVTIEIGRMNLHV